MKARSPLNRVTVGSERAARVIQRACLEALDARRMFSFGSAVNYVVGGGPYAVETADFNHDGRLDLLTVNPDSNSVSVLLGNAGATFNGTRELSTPSMDVGLVTADSAGTTGVKTKSYGISPGKANGTFGAAQSFPTGVAPRSVAVGDFNADGKLDIVTSNAGDASVLLGNGNGTFAPPTNINVGASPGGVAVGDLNADGKLDLATVSSYYTPGYSGYFGYYPAYWNGRIHVLLGNGNGTFAAPNTSTALPSTGAAVNSVALADLNGDGKLDAATADVGNWWDGGQIFVAIGTGTGSFTPSITTVYSNAPQSVRAADLNGDGKPDLISNGAANVNVALATGAGNFAPQQSYVAGTALRPLGVADFNGDGKCDVAAADPTRDRLSVLIGSGTGVLRPPIFNNAAGSVLASVAFGDFNADGRADAAIANLGSGTISVLLNDGAWPAADGPSLTISNASVTEGNAGTVNAALTVTMSVASTRTITVNYATSDGTATVAGGDYVASSGMLTFAPGDLSKTINVAINGDRIGESNESFGVNLSNATNAFIGQTAGTVTIVDNEPAISIDDYSAEEGNTGTKAFTFTVHLSAASDIPVSVNYSTAEGDTGFTPSAYYYYPPEPATSGTDFQSNSGTVTFAPGQTSKTIIVVVNGDHTVEPAEAFSVDLSNGTAASIADGHAVGMIADDEPVVSVTGGSVAEGNTGTKLLPFTITLSRVTDVPVTVDYHTLDNSATTADGDYLATSSSVTFAAGETSKTVNVTVNGDHRGESDESVVLYLNAATNAGIFNNYGYGMIVDDEPRFSIDSPSIIEGNNGTKLMTFTVTLSAAYDQSVSVKYHTEDSDAIAGKDYTATSGTLTFAAGQTSKTFTVSIKGDTRRERDESFWVMLSNPSSNAVIGQGYSYATIIDDD